MRIDTIIIEYSECNQQIDSVCFKTQAIISCVDNLLPISILLRYCGCGNRITVRKHILYANLVRSCQFSKGRHSARL